MKHTTSHSGWLRGALSACCAGCLLFSVGAVVTGCGPEKQNIAPPDTSGAPPGGGDPKEYQRMMEKNMREHGGRPGGGGGGAPGAPGAPGGAPRTPDQPPGATGGR